MNFFEGPESLFFRAQFSQHKSTPIINIQYIMMIMVMLVVVIMMLEVINNYVDGVSGDVANQEVIIVMVLMVIVMVVLAIVIMVMVVYRDW